MRGWAMVWRMSSEILCGYVDGEDIADHPPRLIADRRARMPATARRVAPGDGNGLHAGFRPQQGSKRNSSIAV